MTSGDIYPIPISRRSPSHPYLLPYIIGVVDVQECLPRKRKGFMAMSDFENIKQFTQTAIRNIFDVLMMVQGVNQSQVYFHAIGQSHLDAAWCWRSIQTRNKAKVTFRNAVHHLAEFDDFTFSQSAPQYYEWMKEQHPRLFRAIQDYVKEGRWEITGGMWIEPDGNLPDGESLVRQRLYGQRFFLNHFGKVAEIAWLPDTFGFAWTLPQIYAKSGAKYFWTTKVLWNDTTKFPFNSFVWRGPDGSELLTFVCPIMGATILKMKHYRQHNHLLGRGQSLVANYETTQDEIDLKFSTDIMPEAGIFYGYGDGGAGPTDGEIAIVRSLKNEGKLDMMTAGDFFRRVEQYKDRLPVWNDEMYLEFHRGCQTTQAATKHNNRKSEIIVRNAEVLHSINSLYGSTYPGDKFRELWKVVLFNQFHDILPGSSIPEVYEDAAEEYAALFKAAGELIEDGGSHLATSVDTAALRNGAPCIINNLSSWTRTDIAQLPVAKGTYAQPVVIDPDGYEIVSQVVDDPLNGTVLTFVADSIPGLGYSAYSITEAAPKAGQQSSFISRNEEGAIVLDNGIIRATLATHGGWLTSLVDLRTGRETLSGPANRMRIYKDVSPNYPAWNIDPKYKKHEISVEPPTGDVLIVTDGPVCATVEAVQKLQSSTARLQYSIYKDKPAIVFTTILDWHDKRTLLKTDFALAIESSTIASDIPYGIIERRTSPTNPAQQAMWERPHQKWFGISDGTTGVAILNEDKYGHSVDGSNLTLTLVRSPEHPRPLYAAWGLKPRNERPKYTDFGEHVIRYAAYVHEGDWRTAEVWKTATDFNSPLIPIHTDRHEGIMPTKGTSISFDAATSFIGAIKRPEDNPDTAGNKFHQLIFRIVEMTGKPDTARITFNRDLKVVEIKETDLLEFTTGEHEVSADGTVVVPVTPYEIKTLRITLEVEEK